MKNWNYDEFSYCFPNNQLKLKLKALNFENKLRIDFSHIKSEPFKEVSDSTSINFTMVYLMK